MLIGSEAGRKWCDTEKKEAVDAFIAATDALLHLFVSWAVTKEIVAKQRADAADKGGNRPPRGNYSVAEQND